MFVVVAQTQPDIIVTGEKLDRNFIEMLQSLGERCYVLLQRVRPVALMNFIHYWSAVVSSATDMSEGCLSSSKVVTLPNHDLGK